MFLKTLYTGLLILWFFINSSQFDIYPFDRYLEVDEIYKDLTALTEEFNENDVMLVNVGESTRIVDINAILIQFVKEPKGKQNLIVVEAGIHDGKERITTAVAHYFIYGLLKSDTKEVRRLARKYNWLIVPLLNIDSYILRQTTTEPKIYKHIKSWKKNMRGFEHAVLVQLDENTTSANFSACSGIDLSLNWDYNFNKYGTSPYVCDENFPGPVAFSEAETAHFSNFLIGKHDFGEIFIYISLHSFPQRRLMIPFSDCQRPTDYDHLMKILKSTASEVFHAISAKYEYGNICELVCKRSGRSIDWAMETIHVNYSFEISIMDTLDYDITADRVPAAGEEFLMVVTKLVENIEKSSANYIIHSVTVMVLVVILNIFRNIF